MRDALSAFTAKFLGGLLLVCYLQFSTALSEETPLKSNNDNPQNDFDLPKRDWNKDLHIWGKRGWSNFHEGWGRKRSTPSWSEAEKRAWSNLHNGWGKRFTSDEDDAVRQMVAMIDRGEYEDYDNDVALNDDEKRNWGKFQNGWDKRNKWDNFRGSWGKREPAWSNLKGIWGKRSVPDMVAQ